MPKIEREIPYTMTAYSGENAANKRKALMAFKKSQADNAG